MRIEKGNADKVWSLIQWNGELKYYYGKRFKLDDANAKLQSMLGDDQDSRIAVLSDCDEATFRITFADEKHEPLDILMEDFIDEKSAKAKGKRVTTLEVASIEDITPEVSPDEEIEEAAATAETGENLEGKGDEDTDDETDGAAGITESPASIEVEGVPMTFEKPKDTQLDLF